MAFFKPNSTSSWECRKLKCAKFLSLMLMLALVACGGGGNKKSNTPQTSKITTRALVSNSFVSGSTGGLQIIDYSKNQQTAFQMGCCATWTRMLRAADGSSAFSP
jgi:hypothetical protein